MSALLVALLLAQSVAPVESTLPVDAPTVVKLEAGQLAPFTGVLLTETQAILQAQRIVGAEAERDALRQSAPSWVQLAVVGGLGLLTGAATVAVIAAVTKR
jgi:hypothetical protein